MGDDQASLTNTDTDVVVIYGSGDPACPPEESSYGRDVLEAAGFTVSFHEVAGANHGELTFHASNDNWIELRTDEPAGQDVVQTIADAALQAS